MATLTPNLGLTLPAGDENVSRQVINDNMMIIDAAAGNNSSLDAMQEGLTNIVDGDTTDEAIPAGAYAYLKNNTHGLAEGYYQNISGSAFPTSGGTANITTFAPVSTAGILNSLNNKIVQVTGSTGVTVDQPLTKIGNTVFGSLKLTKSSEWGHGSWVNGVAQLGSDYPPNELLFSGMSGLAQNVMFRITNAGRIDIYNAASANIAGAFAVISYRVS